MIYHLFLPSISLKSSISIYANCSISSCKLSHNSIWICKSFFFFSLFISLFYSCKSNRYTSYDFLGPQISFGQGGGFTGQVTEYTLLRNGQLFAGTNKEGFVDELPRFEKNLVNQVFDVCEKYEYNSISLDKPGNQYYFFTTRHGDEVNKIQWAPGQPEVPSELQILFNNLKKLTQKRVSETK